MANEPIHKLDAKLGVVGWVLVSISLLLFGFVALFLIPPIGILLLPAFGLAAIFTFVRAMLLA